MAFIINVFVIYIIAVAVWRLYIAYLKPVVSSIPGPFLCKVSDLPSLWHTYQRTHVKWLQGLHRQYGSVVRIGPDRFAISDPAIIPQIYDGKGEYPKSEKMAVMNRVGPDGKINAGMLTTTSKAVHQSIRRPIAKLYSMSNVITYETYIDDCIKLLVTRLDEEFVQTKKECDFSSWAQYWSTDTIAALTIGRPLGFLKQGGDVDGVLAQLESNWRYYALVKHANWVDYVMVKNALRRKFATATVKLMRAVGPVVRQRIGKFKKAPAQATEKDILAQLLELHQQKPEQVPAPRLMSYVGVNLQAGSDTTAIGLRSVVYHALKSPNRSVAKKLQAELDAATDKFPITYKETFESLSYLDAVIKEAQRVHHVGSGIVERVVPPGSGGLTLSDGTILPEGCEVGVSGSTVHFDKAIFGEDADSYNPERWLRGTKETEEKYNERLSAMRAADMTWGRGSRTCLGQHIAKLELYKVVATLFGLFDIELVHPDKEWRIMENFFRGQEGVDIKIAWRAGKSLDSLRQEDISSTAEHMKGPLIEPGKEKPVGGPLKGH